MAFRFRRMRAVFVAATALFALVGFGGAQAMGLVDYEKANKQVVLDFMASLEALDMAKTGKYLSEDFTYQSIMNPARQHGKQKFVDWWWGMVKGATSLTPTIKRVEVMGNTVLIEHTTRYLDPDTDMTFKGTKFFALKDGKIVEYQEYRLPGAKKKMKKS